MSENTTNASGRPAGRANWFQQRNPTSIPQDLDSHPLWVCRNRLHGPVVGEPTVGSTTAIWKTTS